VLVLSQRVLRQVQNFYPRVLAQIQVGGSQNQVRQKNLVKVQSVQVAPQNNTQKALNQNLVPLRNSSAKALYQTVLNLSPVPLRSSSAKVLSPNQAQAQNSLV